MQQEPSTVININRNPFLQWRKVSAEIEINKNRLTKIRCQNGEMGQQKEIFIEKQNKSISKAFQENITN